MTLKLETKCFGSSIIEVKTVEINGEPVGVIDGYIAAWGPDTGGKYGVPDQFHKGAFLDSLQEHRDRGNRQIRLKDMHGTVIGGFPIESVKEDDYGLRAIGHINLVKQEGKAAFSLIKQGVLSDLSIGFSSLDDRIENGIRDIYRANVWEGSVVDEPAHRGAKILEWKSVVPFQDLPLAERKTAWNPDEARERIAEATQSTEAPSDGYKEAFLWHRPTAPEDFKSYVLPIADVVDGRIMAVPGALVAAASALHEAKVVLPDDDARQVVQNLERYYAKMGIESPWSSEERQFIGSIEAKDMGAEDIERALHRGAAFSKGAARLIAARLDQAPPAEEPCYDQNTLRDLLGNLQEAKRALE